MRIQIDPTQKHIILLKLSEAFENVPDFGDYDFSAKSSQRAWLSEVGALFKVLNVSMM